MTGTGWRNRSPLSRLTNAAMGAMLAGHGGASADEEPPEGARDQARAAVRVVAMMRTASGTMASLRRDTSLLTVPQRTLDGRPQADGPGGPLGETARDSSNSIIRTAG